MLDMQNARATARIESDVEMLNTCLAELLAGDVLDNTPDPASGPES